MQQWLEEKVRELSELSRDRSPRSVTLDEVGVAVGDAAVSTQDIEALFDMLAQEGVEVTDLDQLDLPALLRQVLLAARTLKSEGKTPDRAGIAERAGLSEGAVRVALLYADVLRG